MKLYIANCTKSKFILTYSLPEIKKVHVRNLPMGGQIMLEYNKDDLDYIINQHTRYGMQDVNHVKKGFGGLAYRFDKPISLSAIEEGISQSMQEKIDQAQEALKMTVASADEHAFNIAREAGGKQISGLSLEITEEKQGPTDHDKKYTQTIEVVREGQEPKRRGRPPKY